MQKFYNKNLCVKGFTKRIKFFVLLLSTTLVSVTSVANVYVTTTFTDPVFTAVNNATGAITAGAGIGLVSLRSALKAADNLGGTHTITLGTGTYLLDGSTIYANSPVSGGSARTIYFGNTAQNITINGNGPANTIISMAATGRDRIFSINYSGSIPNVFSTINGVKFLNGYLTTDQYGGAAIYAGPVGGLDETLTVNNCAFENNISPGAAGNGGSGGAIYMFQETLVVDNCTFTNNSAVDGVGGAIVYILYNNQGNNGDVDITNSTFTGNSAKSLGGAIHITSQGAQPGGTTFTVDINKNTFLNNFTTTGAGGGVALNNGANLSIMQVHFNRFVGNISALPANSSGLHFVESAGSVNAENNWWGCNTNPVNAASTSPCNQAGGDVPGLGSLDADPWLQLKTTASPSTICNTPAGLGNTTTVTTSFLSNSANQAVAVADLSRLIGLPVTWSTGAAPVLGTLSAQQTTIQASGTATATFTANMTGGNATVNTQVDNVPITDPTARATIIVHTIPVVTDPTNFTSCVGGTASFSSTITGVPAPTIVWRIGTTALINGLQASGSTVSGQGTATLTITNVQPGDEFATYNVRAFNECGDDISANVSLIVNSVTGGTVGSDQTICSGGDPAAFTESVASTGDGVLSYQWQSSTTGCGGAFSNIGGATGTTYDAPAGLTLTTTYRRVTTSTLNAVPCTANSNCITVTINNVTGGTVATNQTICSGGDPAAFTQSVASTGSGALTYQWQSSTTGCGGTFSDIGGATAITYDPPAGLLVTTSYRRVTTSTLNTIPCTANSNCITVTVNDVTGGTIAADQTICSAGDPALLTQSVASTGSGALTYQWQSSTTGCGGAFSNIGGASAITYDPPAGLTVTTTYRRVTTSTLNGIPCTANSNCITVTINNVTGGTVGSDQTICSGGDPALFTESVASTGGGILSYQWQSSTTGCGGAFSNIGGATSASYDPPAGVLVTTNYRRVTTSTLNGVPCTANSNCITVTVRIVTGGTVAASQTICSNGDPAAFTESVASTGDGVLSYQWQSSTTDCSTGFTDIGGATATTYDPPAGLTTTTYYRRVTTSTFNGLACTANSNCLTVTIAATPAITCPTNTSTAACQTQSAVNTAFAAWLATASGSGGVGGVLTNNNSGAPPACGGATTITFTYTNSCDPTISTCQATFTVTAADAVVLTCPVNTSTAGGQTQAAVNAAFAAWLATASGTGGCNGVLTNNNSGAPPAGGGSTTVTFTYTSSCAPLTTTCQATFTVLPPVSVTCPVNTSTAACLTQAQVNTAFSAWLATASAAGGCNGVLTNDNTGAPSACGGATTVTFTYTSTCEPFTSTCSATFTVPAPSVVSLTCPVNTSTAACLTQAQVNTAFSAWLATASASGGCNGVLTNNNTGAPPACGGSTTVTFTYTSTCAPITTTCQATFTVPAPPVVSLTCPVNTSTSACLTQAQVNTAFSAWLATASSSGGCNGVLTNNNTGAPPACGGSTTVTFTYTSTCAPITTTCQATFTVPAPPVVSLTCPVNTSTSACLTQAQVNTAFSAWLATASASGGCNGVLTNNNTGAPPSCGGSTTVTFTYTSTCAPFTTTCQATFTVPAPPVVSLTCPVNTSTSACLTQAQVNTAFSAWLATASASGGCNGVLSNNNTGAPLACGGSTTVTFTYTSSCAPFTTTCQATFTVLAPATVSLTCPVNTTTSACLTQAQVNTAFSAWLATASGTGGCNSVLSNNNTGAPTACTGGSTTVTFTYTSSCAPFTTTCQATFTVPAPSAVVLTCPVNTTTAACQSQASINAAFTAWLATASASGGCSSSLTNNNTGAPSSCGGSTTVTFTYTSSCAPFTTSCSATFTVPPDNTPPSITNVSATPAMLWPPNHQMKDVTINYTATDCGAFTTSLSVTSNEPINGTGDGDTSPDWEVIDNHHVKLRAERAGNGNGRIYTITINATDACGNTSSNTATVIVAHNITAPVSGNSFKVGSTVSFSGTFWDKPGNKHTGKWLIDGSALATATITEPVGNQNGRSTGSYKFTAPGVYKLQMNITDQNGITSYANTQGDLEAIVVIYDPNGGYTYGGGYYDSKAGALTSDPSATGKASYGFSMNYFKNSTNPKGETQFDFRVGDFEYNALNFDYLVINNSMSQFKGTGKIIGGQSGINFIMTVIDGQLDGTGVDKVRMKVFNKNTGRIYYDNMPGASDAALPVQAVGTNSTVVIQGTGIKNNDLLTKTNSEVVPENKGMELAAYPNPSSSNFTIQVNAGNAKEKILLQVFDVSGRIVETRNNVTAGSSFTLGDKYRPGSYFIRVVQGKEHKEIKLIKLSD